MKPGNPLLWVSQNLSANKAAGQLQNANKRKSRWGHEMHISPIVHCGLHALQLTNLNVVASNLLRTCLKSQSLPNSFIFLTKPDLHMFLTLCSQLKFTKMRRRWFEPDSRFQRPKVPDRLWIIKVTYLSVETNKLQRVLPRAYPSIDLNQFSIQQHLHILAAVNTWRNLIKLS